jgi:nucleoid-associated protein YgaU
MGEGAESVRLALARRVSTASALTRRRARAAHVVSVSKYRRPAAAALVALILTVSSSVLAGKWLVKTVRRPRERALSLNTSTSGRPFDRLHLTHTVRDGDTLWKLSQYYYGSGSNASIKRLRDANPQLPENPREMKIGLSLKIPIV